MNTAITATTRDDIWLARHTTLCTEALKPMVDILFLGDSLTDWWLSPEGGLSSWRQCFNKWTTTNMGISADRTQHVLWRLRNGAARGYTPRLVVLLIGTNNTGFEKDGQTQRNTPSETIQGIVAIMQELDGRFPTARIVLLGLFPRGLTGSSQRKEIQEINRGLAAIYGDLAGVTYLDVGHLFLDDTGNIRTDLMPDLLHLSPAGYAVWAGVLSPVISKLLQK